MLYGIFNALYRRYSPLQRGTVLREQQGRHPTLVFAGLKRPDSKVWKKALERAGLTDFR